MTRALTACAIAALMPIGAAAQSGGAAPTQGPMIVEQIHSGVLFAPEVKATEIDKKVSGLVGGSIGWVADATFFIGGGGYWMPETHRNDREMAYGGLVVQWFGRGSERFGWSAKALVGGGQATLPTSVVELVPGPLPNPRDLAGLTPAQIADRLRPQPVTVNVRQREDFLVAEPELNARFGLSKHVRVTLGAGYRFTGSGHRDDGFDRVGFSRTDRLDGATGSIGIQIGG